MTETIYTVRIIGFSDGYYYIATVDEEHPQCLMKSQDLICFYPHPVAFTAHSLTNVPEDFIVELKRTFAEKHFKENWYALTEADKKFLKSMPQYWITRSTNNEQPEPQ